ncbi:MAG TPA: thioredoxin domain-containing protein [Solirubrobacterales bacterium]|nr:thioredoxin domain-containing protein [Solirubrobacterales bacterium]
MSSEVAVKPLPRRGRIWVAALLALALVGLGYTIVSLSTQKADKGIVHVAGIAEAQELFGGVPQEGDRLGSNDAPVTIQVFNDIQCSSCRDDFLRTVPGLMEKYVRSGDVKLLWRHYSNSESPQELGFYGAEAAAEQGYGWQYIYLFFRTQEEANRFKTPKLFENFEASIAGGVEELEIEEWERELDKAKVSDSAIQQRLEDYEELGRNLGIRVGQGMVITGPNGTKTLQEGPSPAEVERTIAEVE